MNIALIAVILFLSGESVGHFAFFDSMEACERAKQDFTTFIAEYNMTGEDKVKKWNLECRPMSPAPIGKKV